MVFPVVLGSGKRLFGDSGKKPLKLADSRTVGDGVAILVYEPAPDAGEILCTRTALARLRDRRSVPARRRPGRRRQRRQRARLLPRLDQPARRCRAPKPAPIALHVAGTVEPVGGQRPAALERVTVEINRHAVVTTRGLPTCPWRRLQSTTSRAGAGNLPRRSDRHRALHQPHRHPRAGALPGGRAHARLQQRGGTATRRGRPRLRHGPGADLRSAADDLRPRRRRGASGRSSTVEMPKIGNEWGYVTGFDLTLKRRYRYRGRAMSVISASCPAPGGHPRSALQGGPGHLRTRRRQHPDPGRQRHLPSRRAAR